MTKREFTTANEYRITCDADVEYFYDAYRGSSEMLSRLWEMYEKKGRTLGVRPEVAGFVLMNGGDAKAAKLAFG